MIVENLVDWFLAMLSNVFAGFEIIGLPIQFINTLETILVYGIWIVGVDIMAIFVSTILAWWGIKLLVGLIVFIWELLPLT